MATISEVINRLEVLEKKHGDKELNIYHSFDDRISQIDESEIFYSQKLNEIYIAIYD